MAHFVLEIKGKSIMVFTAGDRREAEDFVESRPMTAELSCMLHKGRPVWSGNKHDLYVREADPKEVSAWDGSFARARRDNDAHNWDRESWLTYLIPVVDSNTDPDKEP